MIKYTRKEIEKQATELYQSGTDETNINRMLWQLVEEIEELESCLSASLQCGIEHGCKDCEQMYNLYFKEK